MNLIFSFYDCPFSPPWIQDTLYHPKVNKNTFPVEGNINDTKI